MDQHLFFIIISGDGSVIRKEVVRQIPKTNTPLTAAINALLAGPNMSELENDYMSSCHLVYIMKLILLRARMVLLFRFVVSN